MPLRIVGSPPTIDEPEPCVPAEVLESLGLSQKDFKVLLSRAEGVYLGGWLPAFDKVLDELGTRQDGEPIHLTRSDVARIAARCCIALEKASFDFAGDLCEAVKHYLGLCGREQQERIAEVVQRCFIYDKTSPEAAGRIIDALTKKVTIENPEESKPILAENLAAAAGHLVISWPRAAIEIAAAKYGESPRTPPAVKSRRRRSKGQRYRETVELKQQLKDLFPDVRYLAQLITKIKDEAALELVKSAGSLGDEATKEHEMSAWRVRIEQAAAAPTGQSETKKDLPLPIRNGERCVRVSEEMRRIKHMCLEGGRTMADIRHEHPAFHVWAIRDNLDSSDQEVFDHPGRWGAGYDKLVLSKEYDRKQATIKDWMKAYRRHSRARNGAKP